jgi:hypothetical protein
MRLIKTVTILAALAAMTASAAAQSAPPGAAAAPDAEKALSLQLNALSPVAGACRVSFVAQNEMGSAIADAAFEVAFFGKDGVLAKLVSLDFKALPVGKTKVVQFDVDGLACDGVTRVLVNDVATCDGDGLDPATCLAALTTSTLQDVAFGT